MKTTTIKVLGERWDVPRGFGRLYRDEARRQLALLGRGRPGEITTTVIDLMSLVGYAPTREAVADWPLRKRVEAVIYAATCYARASDNAVRRHPAPEWLLNYIPWQGPPADVSRIRADLRGAFAGPTPTEIPA